MAVLLKKGTEDEESQYPEDDQEEGGDVGERGAVRSLNMVRFSRR